MSRKTSKADVEDFVGQKTLAVVGVSRNPKKFGTVAFRELKSRGYRLFPVTRNMEQIDGTSCYSGLAELPERVDGVLVVVPPKQTEQVVREAEAAGIKRVWMQQGSESESAIQFCHEHGITEVHGECILMFAKPVRSFHKFHRGVMHLFRQLPH